MVATETDPFDIFSPYARGNHELYQHMRVADPVHAAIHPDTGNTYWFLTRYDHCQSFLKDPRFGRDVSINHDFLNRNMLNLDGVDHARLKALVHKAFVPSRINSLRTSIQAIADRLLDVFDLEVTDGEDFNLTEQYIEKLPLLSLIELFGMPSADYDQLKRWLDNLLRPDVVQIHETIAEFSAYLLKQIDLRRNNPTKDLLTTLIFADSKGDQLDQQELLSTIFLLFTAGHETMLGFISNSIVSLFEHPDQMRLLVDNLDNHLVVQTAIEEMLRYNGPSYITLPSWALEDVEIGGKLIRRGDVVYAVLDAANRDPAYFAHPHTFDLLRYPNKHIAFSNGIHHCLGAPLARLGGEIAITTLFRRIPNL